MNCNQFTKDKDCLKNNCHWCTDKYYYDICTNNPKDCYSEKQIDKLKKMDYINEENSNKDFNTLYEIIYKNDKKNKIYIILIILVILLLIIYIFAIMNQWN